MIYKLLLIYLITIIMSYQTTGNINTEKMLDLNADNDEIGNKSKFQIDSEIKKTLQQIESQIKLNNRNSAFDSYLYLCDIYLNELDFLKAEQTLEQADKLILNKNVDQVVKIFQKKALINYDRGNLKDALKEILLAEMNIRNVKDNQIQSTVYRTGARIYNNYQDYNKSLEYSKIALEKAKISSNKSEICKAYIQLAVAYSFLSDYQKSYNCFITALKYTNNNNTLKVLIGLGNLMINHEKDYEAIEYLNKAQTSLINNNNYKYLLVCYYNLSVAHMNIKQFSISEAYLEKCLALLKTHSSFEMLDIVYELYGLIKFNVGNLNKAQEYFLEGIKYANITGSLNEKQSLLNYLSMVYEKKGNIPKTLSTKNELLDLKEILKNNSNREIIDLLKNKFEIEKQIINLNTTNEELNTRRLFLEKIIILGLCIALLALTLLYIKISYTKKIKIKTYELKESSSINEKIYDIIHNDIKQTMLPITLHIHETTKTKNPFIREEYQHLTEKLNEILYEVNKC